MQYLVRTASTSRHLDPKDDLEDRMNLKMRAYTIIVPTKHVIPYFIKDRIYGLFLKERHLEAQGTFLEMMFVCSLAYKLPGRRT